MSHGGTHEKAKDRPGSGAVVGEADRDLAKGLTVSDFCCKVGIAETTYYRWRQRHSPEQVDWIVAPASWQLEVDHLKRLVAKLLLDKQMLQDIAKKLGRQSLIDEGILK